ncbi:MAG: acyl carrier protein [Verrucomicrobiota bacterium]
MKVGCDPESVVAMLREEAIVELPTEFDENTDLFSAGMDSMAVMQLIVVIEERFGVALGAAEASREALGTPARMAATINLKR